MGKGREIALSNQIIDKGVAMMQRVTRRHHTLAVVDQYIVEVQKTQKQSKFGTLVGDFFEVPTILGTVQNGIVCQLTEAEYSVLKKVYQVDHDRLFNTVIEHGLDREWLAELGLDVRNIPRAVDDTFNNMLSQ
jgi:hypothetical protein